MTVYAITDTKKGRTGIAPTYLQTTRSAAVYNGRILIQLSVQLYKLSGLSEQTNEKERTVTSLHMPTFHK